VHVVDPALRRRRRGLVALTAVAAASLTLQAGPGGAGASDRASSVTGQGHGSARAKAGLVMLCSGDGFVRVGGLNDSPVDVTIAEVERGANGKPVDLLGTNASDQLRAIFPITIPRSSKYVATWDLATPATVRGSTRPERERTLHGSWLPKQWVDENGLTYQGTGGTAAGNGTRCSSPATTVPSTTIGSTTTTAATSSTVAATTTSTSTPAPTTLPPVPTTVPDTTVPDTTVPDTTVPDTTVPGTTVPDTTVPTTSTTIPSTPPVEPPLGEGVEAVVPVRVWSTSNSQLAGAAVDRDVTTMFVTQMGEGAPPTWAWLAVDLGRVRSLRSIDWIWRVSGLAAGATIRTSLDGRTWTELAAPGDAPAWAWQRLDVAVDARYVRWYFRNPNRTAQLGGIGEVRIGAVTLADPSPMVMTADIAAHAFGPLGLTAPSAVAGNPTTPHWTVSGSTRSSNSAEGSSRLPLDGDPATAWSTAMSVAPTSGWVGFDLGAVRQIGRIRWKFAEVGFADSYRIQVSDDLVTWRTVATLGNPAGADTWQTIVSSAAGRYVRFFFVNPNRDPQVGGLSEVRFHAS
jgi:hypothetical protein